MSITRRVIPQGYLPWLSPNGAYVAYGNQRAEVQSWDGELLVSLGSPNAPCGWLDHNYIGVSLPLTGLSTQLSLKDLHGNDFSGEVNPSHCAGLQGSRAVAGGHTFCSVPAAWLGDPRPGWLRFVDEIDVTDEQGEAPLIVSPSGEHYLYVKLNGQGWAVCETGTNAIVVQSETPARNHALLSVDGQPYVFVNGIDGIARVFSPFGSSDCNPGEARAGLSYYADTQSVMVWTIRIDAGRYYILGRPLENLPNGPAIIVPDQYGVGFGCVRNGDDWRMVGYTEDTGEMTLSTVPVNTERKVFVPTPDQPPAPVERPQFPPVPDTFPPTWIGCETDVTKGHPKGIGNCAWSAQPNDDRPVTEMTPWAETVEGRILLCGLWLSDNGAKGETVEPEIAFAKAKGAFAVYLHKDDWSETQTLETAKARQLVTDAGLRPFHGQHVKEGEQVFEANQLGITCNVRTFGKDLAKLRDGIVNVVHALSKHQGVPAVCFLTGWFAGGPLEVRYPEAAAYLTVVAAKIPTPATRPGQPLESPTLPPDAPKPPRPPSTLSEAQEAEARRRQQERQNMGKPSS